MLDNTPTVCEKSKIGQHVYQQDRYDDRVNKTSGICYECIHCHKTVLNIDGDGVIFVSEGRAKDLEAYEKLHKY